MYLQRTLEFYLKQVDKQFPVLLVTGPRQVGKTTILRHLSQKLRTYVSLDDPVLAQLAKPLGLSICLNLIITILPVASLKHRSFISLIPGYALI